MSRRRFLVLTAAALASACAPAAQTMANSTASAAPPLAANPTRGIWPVQYQSAPQQVRDAYSWAATHQNILQYIPCYCGCGTNGHENNFDCFVKSREANGETAAMTAKGSTVRQMRTAIDARWSATGPSTPTPLP